MIVCNHGREVGLCEKCYSESKQQSNKRHTEIIEKLTLELADLRRLAKEYFDAKEMFERNGISEDEYIYVEDALRAAIGETK